MSERGRYIPPGAEPTTALPSPLYTPLNPPAAKKPCRDCARVLRVSIGKKRVSTLVPASPPETRATVNEVGAATAAWLGALVVVEVLGAIPAIRPRPL